MGPQNAHMNVHERVRVPVAKTLGQSEERGDQSETGLRTRQSEPGVMQLSTRATGAHPGSANCARTHSHARTHTYYERSAGVYL